MVMLMKVQLLNIGRIYQVWIIKMAPANTEQELKVNKAEEEFQMIVVCLWQFKFKIAKILNILTEVVFFLVVEIIH